MDNIEQPSDPEKSRPFPIGSGNGPHGEGGRRLDTGYQEPNDNELSPEVQLAWFELNREQTQRNYIRVMRIGGVIGALVLPFLLLVMNYVQTVLQGQVLIGLPELHEDPNTAMIYWGVIGVFGGFLSGVLLAALGFWLLQRFNTE